MGGYEGVTGILWEIQRSIRTIADTDMSHDSPRTSKKLVISSAISKTLKVLKVRLVFVSTTRRRYT